MKKIFLIVLSLCLFTGLSSAAEKAKEPEKTKVILLISEQNIDQAQKYAWWLSEVDLSTTEAALAQRLLAGGLEILEPSMINKTVKSMPAFRVVDVNEGATVKLGKSCKANYIVLGKAVASVGGPIPQSTMRSCFANITAKLIRVSDGKVIAYLDASGKSVHMDTITGGREALANAGADIANKIIDAINKSGVN